MKTMQEAKRKKKMSQALPTSH